MLAVDFKLICPESLDSFLRLIARKKEPNCSAPYVIPIRRILPLFP